MCDFERIRPELESICKQWGITRLTALGSSLRQDFSDESDIDLIFNIPREIRFGLFQRVDLQDELGALIGTSVDLITERSVEWMRNLLRRDTIQCEARVLYSA